MPIPVSVDIRVKDRDCCAYEELHLVIEGNYVLDGSRAVLLDNLGNEVPEFESLRFPDVPEELKEALLEIFPYLKIWGIDIYSNNFIYSDDEEDESPTMDEVTFFKQAIFWLLEDSDPPPK